MEENDIPLNLQKSHFSGTAYTVLYLLFFGGKFPPKRHKNFLSPFVYFKAISSSNLYLTLFYESYSKNFVASITENKNL